MGSSKKKVDSKVVTSSHVELDSQSNPLANGAPSDAFLKACAAYVQKAHDLYAKSVEVEPLSPIAKKRAFKMRKKGGAAVVAGVLALWQKYGAPPPTVSTAGVPEKLAHAVAAQALRHELEVLMKLVDDDIFINQSECWRIGTQLYGVLKKIAASDASLRLGLASVEDFFKQKNGTKSGKTKRAPAAADAGATPPAVNAPSLSDAKPASNGATNGSEAHA